ncbi:MAG: putative quinol monooxygenase [Actinomycetota bacterium]
MSGPFIYVGTFTIKPGKLEEARKHLAELIDFVETNEPRMIAFHAFLDGEGSKLVIVQVHPDSASMEFHLQINAKHFATAFDYLETFVSDQYYGAISDAWRPSWPNGTIRTSPLRGCPFTKADSRAPMFVSWLYASPVPQLITLSLTSHEISQNDIRRYEASITRLLWAGCELSQTDGRSRTRSPMRACWRGSESISSSRSSMFKLGLGEGRTRET